MTNRDTPILFDKRRGNQGCVPNFQEAAGMISKLTISIFAILNVICLTSTTLLSAEFCPFEIREVVKSKNEHITLKQFPYIDEDGKTELIELKDIPEIKIPSQFVNAVSFNVLSLQNNEYVKNSDNPMTISFDKSFLTKIKKFIEINSGKEVAVLVCNKIIGLPTVTELWNDREHDNAGLGLAFNSSLDKKIALIANLGISPNYGDIYVKYGPPDYKNVTKNYKFKSPFDKTLDVYPTTLTESEFWVTKEEIPISYDDTQHRIMLPKRFYVEQLFSSNTFKWEFDNESIKIENPYGTGEAWIKRNSIVPFFSTLSTDLFLGTFFINNENEWQLIHEKKEYYWNNFTTAKREKIKSIRKLYIKEALSRFINENEFKKWYLNNFNKPFVED